MSKQFTFAILLISTVFAGTTGKIAGVVTDEETGDPLIGCNIIVEGTDLGAATNLEGQYFILNVPPGIYNVKAMMIGYTPQTVQEVRVSVDLTTRVDFELGIEVVKGKEVTVIADRPVIKHDLTSSEARVSSDQLEVMPVNEIWEVLSIQSGVTKDAGGGIHIRGGRSREVAYWVDGVSVTDGYDGGISVAVDNNSIQELQVISGTFNAEYGQSMSGIINLVTKDGGKHLKGGINVYGAGYFTDDSRLKGLNTFNPLGEKNFEVNLSGPVPLLGDLLTFYGYVRSTTNEGWLKTYRVFDRYGNFTESGIRWLLGEGGSEPELYDLNQRNRLNTNAKLTLSITPNLKLRASHISSHEKYQDYRHEAQWSPEGELQRFSIGENTKLSLTHTLSSKTFYTIDVARFRKNYHHYAFKNIYEDQTVPHYFYQDTSTGAIFEIGKGDDNDFWYVDINDQGQPEVVNISRSELYDKTTNTYPSPYIDPYYYTHQEMALPPSTFKIWGVDHSRFERETTTSLVKFDFTTQLNSVHQIKFGAETRDHYLTLKDFNIEDADETDTVYTIKVPGEHLIAFDDSMDTYGVYNVFDGSLIEDGFDSKSKAENFSDFYNKYVEYGRRYYEETPREFSAYLQDKIEYESLIINVGVRYDWFNSNSVIPMNPAEPYLGNPRNPDIDTLGYRERENIDWTSYAGYYANLLPDSGESLKGQTGWWKSVEAKQQISPRFGIAYPITDKGVIHFSFGHFFQIPSFERLFANPGYKIPEESGKFGIFRNPDLKPQKTVMYEIGFQQEVLPGMSVDMTGYYRDVRDWVTTGVPVNLGGGASYYTYINKDYSNVRGVTLNVDRRLRNNLGFNINYTFQIAEGSNSNPDEEFAALRDNQEPTRAILPLNWDQTHTVNGAFYFGGRRWTLSMLGQFGSGYPYTPTINIATTSGANVSSDLKTNSRRKPITYNLDLNYIYTLQVKGIATELYVKVFNVLDRRNELTVYGDTGRANSTITIVGEQSEERPNGVMEYYSRPDWFSAPRQIQIGMRFSL